jgi:hypothetical protein
MLSPYYDLIRLYFPSSEWERANCIANEECSPDRVGYPETCIGDEGLTDCGHGAVQSRSWGPFQILDSCWNPDLNPNSPFTHEQWAMVLDPNVNTWMASVIWSRSGWGAWTTCGLCEACNLPYDTPIPYPNGPVSPQDIVVADIITAAGAGPAVFGLGALIIGLMLLPVGK